MLETSAQVPGLAHANKGWLKVVPGLRQVRVVYGWDDQLRYDVFVKRPGGFFRLYRPYWARVGVSLDEQEVDILVRELKAVYDRHGLDVQD